MLKLVLILRSGAAKRTHYFPKPPPSPNELIYAQEVSENKFEGVRERGVEVITTKDIRWQRCDAKSVNLLPNCLTQEAAKRAGAEEAIFIGDDGCVTEGIHTNVFGVKDGTLFTAPLSNRILAGITRTWVLNRAAEAGVMIYETPIRADDIPRISEMFLAGTTVQILGVRAVDWIAIGRGRTGDITFKFKLFHLYKNEIISFKVHS